MKAIGYSAAGPADTLDLIEIDRPEVGPRDLLVAVKGISVNPVDVKLRAAAQPEGAARVLGFDAAGVVAEVGASVTGYKIGDEVFYAGDVTRAAPMRNSMPSMNGSSGASRPVSTLPKRRGCR